MASVANVNSVGKKALLKMWGIGHLGKSSPFLRRCPESLALILSMKDKKTKPGKRRGACATACQRAIPDEALSLLLTAESANVT